MKAVIAIYASIAAIVLTMFYGWVVNIIAVVHAPALAMWGGLEVMRVIGIFVAPLGAILGLFF